MKIRLSDLKERPCNKYYDYIEEHYDDGEFYPKEVLESLNAVATEVSWLIRYVEICQTEEWFDYYKANTCTIDSEEVKKIKKYHKGYRFEYRK